MAKKPISQIVAENPTWGRHKLHKNFPEYSIGKFNHARIKFLKESLIDETDYDNSYKIAKSKQTFMDKNRFLNKIIRDQARVDSGYEEFIEKLEKFSNTRGIRYTTPLYPFTGLKNGVVGVIHLTDWHLGETVYINGVNDYNFEIASQRLFRLYEKSILYLKDCDKVFVLMTGDMINSDRRIGEITGNECSRAEAAMKASILIEDFLLHLATRFNIHVAAVCGNESRINLIHGHEDYLMKDNYDFIIYKTLESMLKNEKNIYFEKNHSFAEHVINVCDKNFLMIHGDTIKGDVDRSIQNMVGKYARRRIFIDYVIYGHLHSAMISDHYARGSSLVGSNEYSDTSLNFSSKPSQNIHLVFPGGDIDSIKVDLSSGSKQKFRY